MAMNMYPSDQENDVFYPKEEDGGVDYFEWCASFLTAPKDGCISSGSSTCSSGPSTPNISPYSTPEQYPPPSPSPSDASMSQYCYDFQDESPRIVVPQVFQTINIGVVQQYPSHHHPSILSHSQGGFNVSQARPLLHQIAHNQVDLRNTTKELLVIDHSKEIQKRKAVVMDVTPVGSEVPEFSFTPSEMNGDETRVTIRPSVQLPQAFYRNCYEMLRMKVPGGGFEGYRVYVHNKLGYSGNAKRFKQGPDAGEKAFILQGEILNQNMEPIIQCQACEEYFRDASRRILLIKNNVPIHIRNGEFQLQMKLMCCSSHHNTPFYFHFSLYDHVSKRTAMNSVFAVNVKQWKNMGSTGNKRRKSDDSR